MINLKEKFIEDENKTITLQFKDILPKEKLESFFKDVHNEQYILKYLYIQDMYYQLKKLDNNQTKE